MKKIITNATDAICYNCGARGATTSRADGGYVICAACGKAGYLRDPRGHAFQPVYGPARTFRASKYTPELPDRRIKQQPWPLIRERRAV